MRYNPINNSLFTKNRKKLSNLLKPNAVAILNANDTMPTNADGTFPFRQNNDLYYLSGINQEETILFLYPDAINESDREILFIKETSELIAIWEGHKHTIEEARKLSGINSIHWLKEFENITNNIIPNATSIYLNSNEHTRSTNVVQTRDNRFRIWCKRHYPSHQFEKLAPLMHQLRYVKEKEEIDNIQHACTITEKAFRRILKFIKPGVKEYEIEAEIIHEFIKSGSKGHAYQPIIASGSDSCVLHYIDNSKECKHGDILLLDFGAEYANYNSDLSRTIPIDGTFSERQKAVYNATLEVQKKAINILKEGISFPEYNKEVGLFMEEQLIQLHLLDKTDIKNQDPKNPLYRKYFMHGTSHSLGLDVHDVDDRSIPFKEGMVFTCEPGIYIREEGIGVRIENNILITSTGNFDLMKNIPREVEEIEDLMNEKRLSQKGS